jgi:hypothetical protein
MLHFQLNTRTDGRGEDRTASKSFNPLIRQCSGLATRDSRLSTLD